MNLEARINQLENLSKQATGEDQLRLLDPYLRGYESRYSERELNAGRREFVNRFGPRISILTQIQNAPKFVEEFFGKLNE